MQVVTDLILTDLESGVGKTSGKDYYRVKGIIVGCQELPVLSGAELNVFVTKETFDELAQVKLSGDRFNCLMGVSKVSGAIRGCDCGLRFFINGKAEEKKDIASVPDENAKNEKEKK